MKNDVLCIVAKLDELPKLKEKWGEHICKARKEKIEQLKGEQDKKRSLLAEYLLFEVLSELVPKFMPPCRWETESKGKLILTDYPHLHCNISHDGEYAAVALAAIPVGIDIAHPHAVPSRLAQKIMTAREYSDYCDAVDKQEAFFTCWTRKESYQKLLGEGFYRPMPTFETSDMIYYEGRIEGYFLCISTYKPANVRIKKVGQGG